MLSSEGRLLSHQEIRAIVEQAVEVVRIKRNYQMAESEVKNCEESFQGLVSPPSASSQSLHRTTKTSNAEERTVLEEKSQASLEVFGNTKKNNSFNDKENWNLQSNSNITDNKFGNLEHAKKELCERIIEKKTGSLSRHTSVWRSSNLNVLKELENYIEFNEILKVVQNKIDAKFTEKKIKLNEGVNGKSLVPRNSEEKLIKIKKIILQQNAHFLDDGSEDLLRFSEALERMNTKIEKNLGEKMRNQLKIVLEKEAQDIEKIVSNQEKVFSSNPLKNNFFTSNLEEINEKMKNFPAFDERLKLKFDPHKELILNEKDKNEIESYYEEGLTYLELIMENERRKEKYFSNFQRSSKVRLTNNIRKKPTFSFNSNSSEETEPTAFIIKPKQKKPRQKIFRFSEFPLKSPDQTPKPEKQTPTSSSSHFRPCPPKRSSTVHTPITPIPSPQTPISTPLATPSSVPPSSLQEFSSFSEAFQHLERKRKLKQGISRKEENNRKRSTNVSRNKSKKQINFGNTITNYMSQTSPSFKESSLLQIPSPPLGFGQSEGLGLGLGASLPSGLWPTIMETPDDQEEHQPILSLSQPLPLSPTASFVKKEELRKKHSRARSGVKGFSRKLDGILGSISREEMINKKQKHAIEMYITETAKPYHSIAMNNNETVLIKEIEDEIIEREKGMIHRMKNRKLK